MESLKRFFFVEELKSDLKTELAGGFLTFSALIHVFVLNAVLFERAGLHFREAYMATLVSFALVNLYAAFAVKLPFVLAPSMAISSYFVNLVVIACGVPYASGIALLLTSALIVGALSFTRGRESLTELFPLCLRRAMRPALGGMLALFGLFLGKVIVASSFRLTTFGNIYDAQTFLTLIGFIVTLVLVLNKVRFAYALGMIVTALCAFCLGELSAPDGAVLSPLGMERTIFGFDFAQIFALLPFVLIVATSAVAENTALTGALTEDNAEGKRAWCAASIGSVIGSCCGMGSFTLAPENSLSKENGGKTGLVPLTAALLGLAMLFAEPLAQIIAKMPSIIAPPLIITGIKLLFDIKDTDTSDLSEAVPAYAFVFLSALTFNIGLGLGASMLLYVFLKIFSGRKSELTKGHYALSLLFAFYVLNFLV